MKYCQSATVRKLIPMAHAGQVEEKCSSAGYVSCPVYRTQTVEGGRAATCPYIRESLMQYCGAAPVAKFVPYSESLLSRCGNDTHRYCELFLGMSRPQPDASQDEIYMPKWLRYSVNHMWLDVTGDGMCHAGIDAFLSRALGKVDRISYLWTKGLHRPAAVLTVGGMELEVVFPNPFVLTGCNLYLRADPSRLTAEPYTGGWLFEGTPEPGTTDGLMEGAAAEAWMELEQRRISEVLQQHAISTVGPTAADGGLFTPGIVRQVERDQGRVLFHEFFSPMIGIG